MAHFKLATDGTKNLRSQDLKAHVRSTRTSAIPEIYFVYASMLETQEMMELSQPIER